MPKPRLGVEPPCEGRALMYLVDSSIWIDHFRKSNPRLVQALTDQLVMCHPFIIGELALGSLKDRQTVISMLQALPQAAKADDDEVLKLIETQGLFSRGLGLIDAHLIASALIEGDVKIWTGDKRLAAISDEMNLGGMPVI